MDSPRQARGNQHDRLFLRTQAGLNRTSAHQPEAESFLSIAHSNGQLATRSPGSRRPTHGRDEVARIACPWLRRPRQRQPSICDDAQVERWRAYVAHRRQRELCLGQEQFYDSFNKAETSWSREAVIGGARHAHSNGTKNGCTLESATVIASNIQANIIVDIDRLSMNRQTDFKCIDLYHWHRLSH